MPKSSKHTSAPVEEPFADHGPLSARRVEEIDAARMADLLDEWDEAVVARAWMHFMVARAYFDLTDGAALGRTERTRILKMLAKGAGISTTRLHALLNQYFYARSIDAFLPAKNEDGRRIVPRVEEIIAEESERLNREPDQPTRVALVALIRQRCEEEGLAPPARNTILLRLRSLS